MARAIKVSVIIPVKNPGPLFREVLGAVLSQETSFDFDVFIVDSGSTDGTIEYINGLHDPRLTLHQIPPETFGHGRTRNLAVSLTSGEYCALITHDAKPFDPHWLANLVAPAEADPNVAGVFGRHVAYPDASPFTKLELEAHFRGLADFPKVRKDQDPERYVADQGWRQVLHFFSDNNALVRRSVWKEIQYPDVDFAEDQIWAHSIIEAGWSKAYAYDAVVYHSHDYGLFERLQRSFDESFALYRLFGYRLCPSFQHLWRSTAALSRRDLKLAWEGKWWWTHRWILARAPIDNLMRLTGHWLGSFGTRMPQWLLRKLSRDRRMLMGLTKRQNASLA